MSYVRQTGGREYARRRRQRRAQLIIAVLAAVVLGGFLYASAYAAGWLPGSAFPNAGPSCTVTVTRPPQSRVTVNVYNASTNQGQAADIWRALKSRDFQVGAVSNDPYREKLTGVGQIRVGPQGEQFARTYVMPLVPGAQLIVDGRDDTSVDVVLGDKFPHLERLTPPAVQGGSCATSTI